MDPLLLRLPRERRPRLRDAREGEPGAPFSSSVVPGFCDGDYPPWLQTEMKGVLPSNVIESFGRQVPTFINGWYVHFDQGLAARIVAMLESRGFEVVERGDLMFW